MRIRSAINRRKWRILATLISLNLKFFFFKSKHLLDINKYRSSVSLKISSEELRFTSYWNLKLSQIFSSLGSPYAACMKRSFFIAILIDNTHNAVLHLGITPDAPSVGHAWVIDDNGRFLAETYDKDKTNYQIVKSFPIR